MKPPPAGDTVGVEPPVPSPVTPRVGAKVVGMNPSGLNPPELPTGAAVGVESRMLPPEELGVGRGVGDVPSGVNSMSPPLGLSAGGVVGTMSCPVASPWEVDVGNKVATFPSGVNSAPSPGLQVGGVVGVKF